MSERVVILFGGASDERRVSVASAQNVSALLPDAEPWFEALDGRIYRCPREHLAAHQNAFVSELSVPGEPAWPSLAAALDAPGARETTFFLAYHGAGVEDGTAQRLFEARNLAFTGSGSQASADAFNKESAKAVARRAGVRTVESVDLPREAAELGRALAEVVQRLGRVVAKPISGGSSVGLHHVRPGDDLHAIAAAIAATGQGYMAEQFVQGTELTVGVVDGPEGTRALPCSEVRVAPGRAFDYAGKYLAQGTIELTPAEVAPEISRAAQALAVRMHQALGCEGYSRTDVIVGPQGPVFLETNTLPGLTKASFIPQQLAAEGKPIRDFLLEQLGLARRRRDRARAA